MDSIVLTLLFLPFLKVEKSPKFVTFPSLIFLWMSSAKKSFKSPDIKA